jgi:hypothetical protein
MVFWTVETNTHTTTAAADQTESWDSGDISSPQTFSHTFTHAGTFNYYCMIHGHNPSGNLVTGMSGNVVVNGITPSGLSTLTLANTTVHSDQNTTATLTLTDPAPDGGANITFSSNTSKVVVTSPVVIPAGNTSANTTVVVLSTTTPFSANLTASYNGTTKTTTLSVIPLTGLTSLSILPDTVVGGATATGNVTLGSASASKTVVDLHSSDPSATVPATLTIAKGSTTANFTIKTKSVTSETMPLITASSAGVTKDAMLMVEPIEIQSVAVNPATVIGGNTSNGTVTLLMPPPAAISVSLSSSNTTAKVPRTVNVAKGNFVGTFKVTTTKPKSVVDAQIDASYKGSSANTTLTIDPPGK